MRPDRRSFLASVGAAATGALLAPAVTRASVLEKTPPEHAASHALVLSGGGARRAYQAGLICAIAERNGIADGHPLRPYELVCGTSIGAINAWFVATGNYSALRRAWASIGSEHIVELKRPYNVLTHPHRFIGERVYAAVKLAIGITKHVRGIARAEPVRNWMAKHMDPSAPIVTPMVWAGMNLTAKLRGIFLSRAPSFDKNIPETIARAFRIKLGEHTVVR